MKRHSFLTAAAAAALAGCGHKAQSSGIVPAVTPQGLRRTRDAFPAEPIPQYVLANPILGEARRYDDAVPPAGWVIAQGQTMQIAENRALFAILGKSRGGDGKTTFTLPNPRRAQYIIAVTGVVPASPRALAALRPGRNVPTVGPVIARPGYAPLPKPVIPDGHPLWAPGTIPTPELIEAQEASARAPAPMLTHGSHQPPTR
jgi:Phage Tail Collar Domain